MSNRLSTITASNLAGRTEPVRANSPTNSGFGRALIQARNEPPAAKPDRRAAVPQPQGRTAPAAVSSEGPSLHPAGNALPPITPTDRGGEPAKTDSPATDDTSLPFNPKDIIQLPGLAGALPAVTSIGATKSKMMLGENPTADQRSSTLRPRNDAQNDALALPPDTPAGHVPAPIAPPPAAAMHVGIPLPSPQQTGQEGVRTANAGLIAPGLPGPQPAPSFPPQIGDAQQNTPAKQPETLNLGIEPMLAGLAGSLKDRPSAATPSDPTPTALTLADLPAIDAVQTAATSPVRKGSTPAGAEPNETGAVAIPEQVDMSGASAAASHTPASIAGPMVLPPAPLGHGPATVSIANQILPSVIALAQGHASGDRISISMSPDLLGHVSIIVDRATDGTTSIQISAERLATMELLRTDQADLLRALHEAGVSQNGSSLSFSWQGGNGGMQGWAGQGEPQAERRPASAQLYTEDPASIAAVGRAVTHGGVDVTA